MKMPIKILLYADAGEPRAEALTREILSTIPQAGISRAFDLDGLSRRLARPLNRVLVILAFAPCTDTLKKLLELKPLFDNKKLILILKSYNQGVLPLGLKLGPSFISGPGSDLADVPLVINQIRQKLCYT